MIKIVSFAAKLPLSIVEEVRTFCKEKGMKLGAFISEAIKEKYTGKNFWKIQTILSV